MRNILVSCILLVSLIGCLPAQKPEPPSVLVVHESENVSCNFDLVVTVGNRSYLPINKGGDPAGIVMDILYIMDQFEKKHPEWEITSWHIEKMQRGHFTTPYVYGLWVDHKSQTIK